MQCGGCQPLKSRNLFSTYLSVIPKEDGKGCTQILTCNATIPNSTGRTRLTFTRVKDGGAEVKEKSSGVVSEITCTNGKWYLSDNTEVLNTYDCEHILPTTTVLPKTTYTSPGYPYTTTTQGSQAIIFTTTPMRLFPYTTTTPGNLGVGGIYTTTTQPPPHKPTVSTTCNPKGPLFQQFTSNADTSSTKWGTFAGFFKYRSACQRLCNKNYKEKCFGYMYDPNNRGTCTIFQSSLYYKITEDKSSKISVYKKCVKMPPAVSAKCCGPLVQSLTTSNAADGIMKFAYSNNTCRSTATITCSQIQGMGLGLYAGIVVNEIHQVAFNYDSVSSPATCNNGIWQIGDPSLNIASLECYTTDPV
uniref:Uncharacterized protein n=1 Tax=Panagrolaimus davidi TaxID=227884 RepID=A0A914QSF1_9BILA